MKFRIDINGLRALAVLIVVVFHFDQRLAPGGFIGVDVFFVISGYLMTAIISKGLEAKSFKYLAFFNARVKRIVPSLLVLCAVLLGFGWFYLLPLDYLNAAKHAASSLLFLSNFLYWQEAGYFALDSHEKWLLHTWSLSAEWQFYMFYPVLLIALRRVFNETALLRCMCIMLLAGFVLSVLGGYKVPGAAFYLLPTRAWEMMLGGVAYLYVLRITARTGQILEVLGIAMIIAGVWAINSSTAWPGPMTLLPAVGAYFVIAAGRGDKSLFRIAVAQWAGRISYSVYLWHWPIVVFMSYSGKLGKPLYTAGAVVASFLIGWFFYRIVEQPYGTSRKQLAWPLAAGYVVVLGFCGLIIASNGAAEQWREKGVSAQAEFVNRYARMHDEIDDFYWVKCDAYASQTRRGEATISPDCTLKAGIGGVFLWGDSHAQALSHGLRSLVRSQGPFYQIATSGCRPNLHPDTVQRGIARDVCNKANRLALDEIARLQPATVVLAQEAAHDQTDWSEIASALRESGVSRVILIGPVPQWRPSLPSAFVRRHWGFAGSHIDDASFDERVLSSDLKLRDQKHDGFEYVSVLERLCNASSCLARFTDTGELLAFDYGHLTPQASLFVAREVLQQYISTPSSHINSAVSN